MSRYSQLYIERGKPELDSERFRRRIAAFIAHTFEGHAAWSSLKPVLVAIETVTGAKLPQQGLSGDRLAKFFETASTRDTLDAITITIRVLETPPGPDYSAASRLQNAADWRKHVERVLQEENLAYRLGRDGIVHPFIDAEFEANRAAAVAGLEAKRLGEARHGFDEAFRHLRNGEGKQAMLMMFLAVETAAKVFFPGGALARLMPNELDKYLLPKLVAKYAGNQPATDAGRALLRAFKEWIIAAQPYRHGQEVQDLAEPPQDFVVAHLSAGATFLRWMIELVE
jgi:hypothetical protein